MIIIQNCDPVIFNIIGELKIKDNIKYRKSIFCVSTPLDNNEYLVYNSFTRQLIKLSSFEYSFLNTNMSGNEIDNNLYDLVKYRLLVPVNEDETLLFNNVRNIIQQLSNTNYYSTFTIYTTTDCNARCYYCFEHGCKKMYMDTKTAIDVANYIIKKSNGNKVEIVWFGGEPLLNTTAIDVISMHLKRNNIDFSSKMISNAYLFDEEIIKRAKEIWNLKRVQVTLDGTEEKYNAIKAYVYKDNDNAFSRVLNNVFNLDKNGIGTLIRLNINYDNSENLLILADQLNELFKDCKNVRVNTARVRDVKYTKFNKIDDNSFNILLEKENKLVEKLREYNLYAERKLPNKMKISHCFANTLSAITIQPDGNIGKCGCYADTDFLGNIYTDSINNDVLAKWLKQRELISECSNCALLPDCHNVDNCPEFMYNCTSIFRKIKIDNLRNSMLNCYKKYRMKQEV